MNSQDSSLGLPVIFEAFDYDHENLTNPVNIMKCKSCQTSLKFVWKTDPTSNITRHIMQTNPLKHAKSRELYKKSSQSPNKASFQKRKLEDVFSNISFVIKEEIVVHNDKKKSVSYFKIKTTLVWNFDLIQKFKLIVSLILRWMRKEKS